ncbi:sulfite exporter TauE/SafE family protein [Algiphilus sp.]|uniref:sulfite exporter TauE/SafE family protein n=1 Tax=Algiphilus sp. TaxID=1872431 RepID=UPI003B5294A2
MLTALLCLAAFATAAVSGALGLGGGTLLIAVLFAAGMPPAEAVPLFALVQLAANGSRSLRYLRAVDGRALLWFSGISIPLAILCAPLAVYIPAAAASVTLGAFILWSLLPRPAGRRAHWPPSAAYAAAGALNGTVGMVIGATGLIVGRLLLQPDWPRPRIVGTVAATQAMGHLVKILAFALSGAMLLDQPTLVFGMVLAAIAGTQLGTRWGDRLSDRHFHTAFRWTLVLLAAHLLISGIIALWTTY